MRYNDPVLRRDYDEQVCSIARALEVVGERWSLLILRDVLFGVHRFDGLLTSLGITRSVLTERLNHLVAEGVLERRRYQTRPDRFEYHATSSEKHTSGLQSQSEIVCRTPLETNKTK